MTVVNCYFFMLHSLWVLHGKNSIIKYQAVLEEKDPLK